MSRSFLAIVVALLTASFAWSAEDGTSSTENNQDLARQISRLVQQLDDNQAAQRDAAEKELLELAGRPTAETDRFLELLPEDNDQMPLAVRERLTHIRQQVEDRTAKSAVEGTTVTLSAKEMPLAEVFAAIEKQTGNRLIDNRQQDAAEPAAVSGKITIELKDEPFWPAVDQILDEANLGIYSYGGERAVDRVARHGRRQRDTAGPATPVRSEWKCWRSRRNEICASRSEQSLKLQLEVAWEPRLRPIAISQPVDDIAGHDRHRRSSCPSASRTPCWMSKCRTARRRPKSSCRSICRRGRRQNHLAARQAAGARARPAGEIPIRRSGQCGRQNPSAAAASK